ncbi:MAG: hypothetical protein H6Q89_5130 [Myxococcaceae bacterium]|nr:hypothetical protein [Myxococcaceae bacterium]
MTPQARTNLARRVAVAAVLLPPVVWLLATGGLPAAALFSAAAALAAFEFYRLAFERVLPRHLPGVLVSAALPWLPSAAPASAAPMALALVVATSAFAWGWHVFRQDVAGAMFHAPLLVEGVVFCAVGPWCLASLSAGENGAAWVLAVVGATFINDTLAFAGGRLFGKHRLAPKVSPGKTWEGLGCGAVGSVGAAAGAVACWPSVFRLSDAVAIAAVTASVGPLGDLTKSLLKRARGVKDAGRLLPGHGGMLDRIDALLLNAPALWAWAQWGH